MKAILINLFLTICGLGFCQESFIQVKTNKVLCLFSFLETSSKRPGTSISFQKYIDENLGNDKDFENIILNYSQLNLDYSVRRSEFPESRHNTLSSLDLFWIAASNAENIHDFKERTIGYLPVQSHNLLIQSLRDAEPFYNQLIWAAEKENIKQFEAQINNYLDKIESLFVEISHFYQTTWQKESHFKVQLYPIPLERGNTTAIPKGNNLICSFLSHNPKDYKNRLGVVVHEMCHLMYNEQEAALQHKLESWFLTSKSPYAKLAYNYFDEGLATAIGNGWAFQQIHKKMDESEWYNDQYINGFAKAIFPMVSNYLNHHKPLDSNFVKMAIQKFEERFPNSLNDLNILMNEIQLFANSDNDPDLNFISNTIHSNFRVRSMWMSTPINDKKAIARFHKNQITKVFIVESNHKETIQTINSSFPEIEIASHKNTISTFYENKTKSPIIIINIEALQKLNDAFKALSKMEYSEFNMNYKL